MKGWMESRNKGASRERHIWHLLLFLPKLSSNWYFKPTAKVHKVNVFCYADDHALLKPTEKSSQYMLDRLAPKLEHVLVS